MIIRVGVICVWALSASCGSTTKPVASLASTVPSATSTGMALLSDDTTGVTFEVSLGELSLRDVTLGGERYTEVRAAGLSHEAEVGHPALPVERRLLAIPEGKEPYVEWIERRDVEDVFLEHAVAFDHRLERHGGTALFAARDAAAYERRHGEPAVSLGEASYAGATRVVWVTLSPVLYDPINGLVRVARSLKTRIGFRDATAPLSAAPSRDGSLAAGIVANPGALAHERGRPRILVNVDVIIAEAAYREALQPLVAFKRERSREVREHYVDRPTAAAILELIKREHQAATVSHVLLVGSIDQIPSHRISGIWSDLAYQQLDAGNVPDASVARIPAQNATELAIYVEKAIVRASRPRDVEKFLLTAGSDTSLGCPANVDVLGRILTEYRPGAVQQKLYRARGATQQQILSAYSAGPNVAIYDGHGDHTGMIEVPFTLTHLAGLGNETLPIVLDIACLNANWPSGGATRRNFAESILLQQGGGAAGIVAAGGNSGGHEFFQRMVTHMVRGGTPDEIGRIVLAAKIESSYFDNYMFGYYGDPALSIF